MDDKASRSRSRAGTEHGEPPQQSPWPGWLDLPVPLASRLIQELEAVSGVVKIVSTKRSEEAPTGIAGLRLVCKSWCAAVSASVSKLHCQNAPSPAEVLRCLIELPRVRDLTLTVPRFEGESHDGGQWAAALGACRRLDRLVLQASGYRDGPKPNYDRTPKMVLREPEISALGRLTALSHLEICEALVIQEAPDRLVRAVSSLRNLQHLCLEGIKCENNGRGGRLTMLQELGSLGGTLTHLSLRGNKLAPICANEVAALLPRLPNLTSLDLTDDEEGAQDAEDVGLEVTEKVLESLGSLTALKKLHLPGRGRDVSPGGPGCRGLRRLLSSSAFTRLEIEVNTHFRADSMWFCGGVLKEAISGTCNLKEAAIYQSNNGEVTEEFVAAMGSMKQPGLRELVVWDGSCISLPINETLLPGLMGLSSLKFEFSSTWWDDSDDETDYQAKSLVAMLKRLSPMTRLQTLWVSGQEFIDAAEVWEYEAVADALRALTQVKDLFPPPPTSSHVMML